MISLLRDKNKWKEIREQDDYKNLRDKLWEEYKKSCFDTELPILTFTDEMEFFRTGKRINFEKLYFLRRKQLTVYALLSVMYPEETLYLNKLQNVIWEICNEHSWVLPAHRQPDWLNRRDGIDLFAAETGLYLAEIKQMLIERLDSVVVDKITTELNSRILESFEKNSFWFERLKSNWAAVCGASVGITFMYESPKRFGKVKARTDLCMEHYLEGIGDDGATSEGVGYWNYGFSFFVMYNEAIKNAYGLFDIFKTEKIKKLSGFLTACFMDEKTLVSFSDADSRGGYTIGTIHFLKKEFDIDMPPAEKGDLSLGKFSLAARSFLYYNPEYTAHKLTDSEIFYEQLQWYMKRTSNYSFAVKGGHNGEEHNHNDIGSFILVKNYRQILCDLGSPEYTAVNFTKERYNILNNSSLGHSVPIVNGHAQEEGKEYSGVLTVSDNVVNIDMKKAYPCEIEKLLRTFEFIDGGVTMTDSFKDIDIVERFVTEVEPQIKEGKVILENTIINYDDNWKPSYTSQTIMQHDGKTSRTVYLIDFVRIAYCDSFTVNITFE